MLSFLGVLAITSTLVLALLGQASAVAIALTGPATVTNDLTATTFTATITVGSTEFVTLSNVKATVTFNTGTTVAAERACPASGCASAGAGVIVDIQPHSTNPGPTDLGYGYGYGYSGVTLKYVITLDPSKLSTGNYRLRFSADTVESAPVAFAVQSPPATEVNTPGGSNTVRPVLDDPPIFLPRKAVPGTDGSKTSATDVYTDSSGRAQLILGPIDPRLSELILNLGAGAGGKDVKVTVTVHAKAPDDLPPGFGDTAALFIDIDVSGETTGDQKASFTFRLSTPQLNGKDPKTVTMLHKKGGSWVVEPTTYGGHDERADEHTFHATLNGFSPFAVTFDEEAPTSRNPSPLPGATVGSRPILGASIADNRDIDTRATQLFIDGQRVNAFVTRSQVVFKPAAPLPAGEHVATLRTVDLSGNVGEELTWRFTTVAIDDTAIPRIGNVWPADQETTNLRPTISADVSDNVALAENGVQMTLDGVRVAATLRDGTLSYTPTSDLSEGWHDVRVLATDTGGNGNYVDWSFFSTASAPEGPPGTSPGDGTTTTTTPPTTTTTPPPSEEIPLGGLVIVALAALVAMAVLGLRRK